MRNNPLRYTDPTGHWTFEETPDDPYVYYNAPSGPRTKSAEPVSEGTQPVAFLEFAATATFPLWGGFAVATGSAVVGDLVAVLAPEVALRLEPTYLVLLDALRRLRGASVWTLDPLERGRRIHQGLGQNLPWGFPTLDSMDWANGVATSIKSLDLGARTYQHIPTLTRTVEGYVNTLARFQGAKASNVRIGATQVLGRELLLAVPPVASEAQMAALYQLQQRAAELGVMLRIVIVP